MGEKVYKRTGFAPDLSESDNVGAVTNILLETVKAGRPPSYTDDEAGLAEFKKNTIAYLEHIQRINESNIEKKVMVDIESWAAFLGITRMTLNTYERLRGKDWQEFIAVVKNGICAAKKEAAFHGQLQPMIAVFDLANNHEYKNTSEFKIEAEPQPKRPPLSASELPNLRIGENGIGADGADELPKLATTNALRMEQQAGGDDDEQ